jgi:two-component system chemotaxis sensor kinase CheA
MIIQDEELRTLFKAESDEHLQRLEEGLLRLESSPADSSTLESLFREAHSLKGAAAMLGVAEVETLAHQFEDALGAAKRQETALTPDAIDRMCVALDDIRSLVALAVSAEIETLAVDPEPDLFAAPAAQTRNETIRVEPHKLER